MNGCDGDDDSAADVQPAPAVVAQIPTTRPAAEWLMETPGSSEQLTAELRRALAGSGWSVLAEEIRAVRQSGPTPANVLLSAVDARPPPTWFLTHPLTNSAQPSADKAREEVFRKSVEAARTGASRVVIGGEILLVEPNGRIWAVARHAPHLLLSFDGLEWTYHRADGPTGSAEELDQLLAGELKRPQPARYDSRGVRNLNDAGIWLPLACADAGGNLHFVSRCVSEEAERRGMGGWSIVTRRRDGTWQRFVLFAASANVNAPNNYLASTRFILHDSGAALATMVSKWGILDDETARLHGFEPHQDGPETDAGRHGAKYTAQFDGESWRVRRIRVSDGQQGSPLAIWPQRDGSTYVVAERGLYQIDEPGTSLADVNLTDQELPLIGGKWRFEGTYPQAAMPDGRLAFNCKRAVNVAANREFLNALVVFDPVREVFSATRVGEQQLDRVGAPRGWRNQLPAIGLESTIIDAERAVWLPQGLRCKYGGYMERVIPPGLELRAPDLVDDWGRVYARGREDALSYVYKPAGLELPLSSATGRGEDDGAGSIEAPEQIFTNVVGVFRQPELAPPWNAWAAVRRDGRTTLIRLDGSIPTEIVPPEAVGLLRGVVPLRGGCIVVGSEGAAIWAQGGWEVAASLKDLVETHGARLLNMVPQRAWAGDLSGTAPAESFNFHLFLAGDGAGGMWLAEDLPLPPPRPNEPPGGELNRKLWHWDGKDFTDLSQLLGFTPADGHDGIIGTASEGRALIVMKHVGHSSPGALWAIWRITPEMAAERRPAGATKPGLFPEFLSAIGPDNRHAMQIWVDSKGSIWSPIFAQDHERWAQRMGGRRRNTSVPAAVQQGVFVQSAGGPVWYTSGRGNLAPMVWVDVSHYPEDDPLDEQAWAGTHVPGMGPAAQLVVDPGGRVWLVHEKAFSLLALRRLPQDATPPLQMTVVSMFEGNSGPLGTRPAIVELARKEWATPRNRLRVVGFDAGAIWLWADGGALLRVPLPAGADDAASNEE